MKHNLESQTKSLFDRAKDFPAATGVYLMKDAGGQVIYVGKAMNLRSRVSGYFGNSPDLRFQVEVLVRRVASLEYILTETEKEAFLLENSLIKQNRPRYNVQLRDDKTYLSIRIDLREDWPRLRVVRKRPNNGALYFGPYTSSHALRETMRTAARIFPLRSCSDRCFMNRTRPCMLYEIGRCCGPCAGLDREEYNRKVQDVISFLRGHRKELVERLKQQMAEAAGQMKFEHAAKLRDQIAAINQTIERQRIVKGPAVNRDVIAAVSESGYHMVMVFEYREGVLTDDRKFEIPDIGQSRGEILRDTISQIYDASGAAPDEIFLSDETEDREILEQYLNDIRDAHPVRMHVPQRGDNMRLIELAVENARQKLSDRIQQGYDTEAVLAEIQSKINLPKPPETIECFDISNIQGSLAVGSMVQFVDGQPNRAGYRMFKIRTVEGANDFAMMHEVMSRRYRRLIESGQVLPDLILVDGGKGQLSVAVEVMKEIGAPDVPLRSIAKSRLVGEEGDRHRSDERFYLPGQKNAVTFRAGSHGLLLLQHVRDEAHRFAIAYHQKLRRQRSLRSLLEELPGIGEARKRALLRHFGSLARIRTASVEELAAVPGMTQGVAADLHRFLVSMAIEKTLADEPPAGEYPSVSEPA